MPAVWLVCHVCRVVNIRACVSSRVRAFVAYPTGSPFQLEVLDTARSRVLALDDRPLCIALGRPAVVGIDRGRGPLQSLTPACRVTCKLVVSVLLSVDFVKMVGMAKVGAPISMDGVAVHPHCCYVCLCYLHLAPENPEDGEIYLLVPAHPGCPDKGQRAVKWLCVCFS